MGGQQGAILWVGIETHQHEPVKSADQGNLDRIGLCVRAELIDFLHVGKLLEIIFLAKEVGVSGLDVGNLVLVANNLRRRAVLAFDGHSSDLVRQVLEIVEFLEAPQSYGRQGL